MVYQIASNEFVVACTLNLDSALRVAARLSIRYQEPLYVTTPGEWTYAVARDGDIFLAYKCKSEYHDDVCCNGTEIVLGACLYKCDE